jgi:predicted nucleic acid binding AN1-type Zn finger protein
MGTTARAFRLSATYKCIRINIRRVVRSISELDSQSRVFDGKRYAIEILWAKLFVFSWRIRTARASSACEHRPRQACNMYGLQTLNHAQRAPNHSEKAIRNVILIAVYNALWSLKDVRTIYV